MKKLFYFATIVLLSLSCRTNDKQTEPSSIENKESSFSIEDAKRVSLKTISVEGKPLKNAKIEANDKEISQTKTIDDSQGEHLFHIIKFKDKKGFRIVSADKQFVPLLGFSEGGEFDETLPGTTHWIQFLVGYLQKEKANNKKDKDYLKKNEKLWTSFESTGYPFAQNNTTGTVSKIVPTGDPCDSDIWDVNRLVRTSWWQGSVYNSYSPLSPCGSNGGYCNRMPVGCGPIAMGQIIRANAVNGRGGPGGYNYASMPEYVVTGCGPYSGGELQAAMLLNNVSNAVGSFGVVVSIPFSCSTSTATLPWGISSGFSQMGYSNGGNYGDFFPSYQSVLSDIKAGYPVIMSGKKGWFGNLNSWHIWVIDGAQHHQYTGSDGNCLTYDWFRCNWGWGGANNDDWYWYGNGNYNGYDTELKSITNIRP